MYCESNCIVDYACFLLSIFVLKYCNNNSLTTNFYHTYILCRSYTIQLKKYQIIWPTHHPVGAEKINIYVHGPSLVPTQVVWKERIKIYMLSSPLTTHTAYQELIYKLERYP